MGFSANSDWWPEAFVDGMAKHFRVLSIDNRSAGRTTAGQYPFTIAQAAEDSLSFLDAMGIEKAHVFGISMGGMIAQAMAARQGHRIDKLILGCTMPRPRTGFLSGLPRQIWLALQYLWNKDVRSRPWLVNIMFSRAFLAQHPEITRQFIQMTQLAKIKPKAWWRQLFAMLCFNGMPHLASIKNPTLILVGTEDLLISPRQSSILQKHIPQAKIYSFQGLGHGFVGEAPQEVQDQILTFLLHPPS